MAHVIVPPMHKADGGPFADLTKDQRQYHVAMRRFVAILAESFRTDAARLGADRAAKLHTQAEERRRADILGRWYRDLRHAGHSHERSMDELSRALRAELDGAPYTPPERNRLWAPGDA